MSDPVRIVLVGIGGYGEVYLAALLDELEGTRWTIVGAVDPEPTRCSRLEALRERRVPLYDDLGAFFRDGTADLAVVSTPIHLHADHACEALAHGCHVLLEKPAAATPHDVDRMIAARDDAGRLVAVGFQWSFAPSILELKRDILAGRFGAPFGARSLTLWSRTERYYRRNDWAGKRRDHTGRWILDSPACNAMAHDLHNLLFLLGEAMDRAASPIGITARTALVNDIETFDTIAARIVVDRGAEVLFLASHTVAEDEQVDPRFRIVFEQATVEFPGGDAPITARYADGHAIEYRSPSSVSQVTKLWTMLDAIEGRAPLTCGLETARPHAACIHGLELSGAVARAFPTYGVRRTETSTGPLRWVPGLASALHASYETGDWPEVLR